MNISLSCRPPIPLVLGFRLSLFEVHGFEPLHYRHAVSPGIGREARLAASLPQEHLAIPASSHRDLREQETSRSAALDENSVAPDHDLRRVRDRDRRREDGDADCEPRNFVDRHAVEAGIVERGRDDRPPNQRQQILAAMKVPDASAELAFELERREDPSERESPLEVEVKALPGVEPEVGMELPPRESEELSSVPSGNQAAP